MLSNYERRVLNEIEVDFARRRAKWRGVLRASRLPLTLLAASAVVALSAARVVSGLTGSLLTLVLGMIIGWLLVSIVRRRILGPRIRRHLKRGSSRSRGLVDPNGH
jgi:hypothetical protein